MGLTMRKYCKQRNKMDCGPTAVLNALKWAGYSHTLKKDYAKIKKQCKFDEVSGSEFLDLKETLEKYKKIRVKRIRSYSLRNLDKIIDEGKSFILLYVRA
jgi:hypothetical protein